MEVEKVASELDALIERGHQLLDALRQPVPVQAALGSKDNPYNATPPHIFSGQPFTLRPRVLNDPSLPKQLKDAIAATLKDPEKLTLAECRGMRGSKLRQRGPCYYREHSIFVSPIGWCDEDGFFVDATDLIPALGSQQYSEASKEEAKLYRSWKDAQLREAANITKKRIMKALAGNPKFKMGDRVKHDNGHTFIYVGTSNYEALILDQYGNITRAYAHNLTKEGN